MSRPNLPNYPEGPESAEGLPVSSQICNFFTSLDHKKQGGLLLLTAFSIAMMTVMYQFPYEKEEGFDLEPGQDDSSMTNALASSVFNNTISFCKIILNNPEYLLPYIYGFINDPASINPQSNVLLVADDTAQEMFRDNGLYSTIVNNPRIELIEPFDYFDHISSVSSPKIGELAKELYSGVENAKFPDGSRLLGVASQFDVIRYLFLAFGRNGSKFNAISDLDVITDMSSLTGEGLENLFNQTQSIILNSPMVSTSTMALDKVNSRLESHPFLEFSSKDARNKISMVTNNLELRIAYEKKLQEILFLEVFISTDVKKFLEENNFDNPDSFGMTLIDQQFSVADSGRVDIQSVGKYLEQSLKALNDITEKSKTSSDPKDAQRSDGTFAIVNPLTLIMFPGELSDLENMTKVRYYLESSLVSPSSLKIKESSIIGSWRETGNDGKKKLNTVDYITPIKTPEELLTTPVEVVLRNYFKDIGAQRTVFDQIEINDQLNIFGLEKDSHQLMVRFADKVLFYNEGSKIEIDTTLSQPRHSINPHDVKPIISNSNTHKIP